MAHVWEDTYGHRTPAAAPSLTAGAVSTTAAGTIAPTTGAGASPTVTSVTACDTYGRFLLNPVTGGGAQAAGPVAVVTFTQPYGTAPRSVIVTVTDTTAAAPVAMTGVATSVTANGFSVSTPVLTTAHNYTVDYHVLP